MAVVVVGVVGAWAVAERAVAGSAVEGLLEASTASSLMPLDFACGEETGRGVRRIYGAPLPDRCVWAHRQQGVARCMERDGSVALGVARAS